MAASVEQIEKAEMRGVTLAQLRARLRQQRDSTEDQKRGDAAFTLRVKILELLVHVLGHVEDASVVGARDEERIVGVAPKAGVLALDLCDAPAGQMLQLGHNGTLRELGAHHRARVPPIDAQCVVAIGQNAFLARTNACYKQ